MTDISQERIEAVARRLRWKSHDTGIGLMWEAPPTAYIPVERVLYGFPELPDFPNDIAACVKYILPQMDGWSFVTSGKGICRAYLVKGAFSGKASAWLFATAIFLAYEKLMEVEK